MATRIDRLVADVRKALDPGGRSDAELLAAFVGGDAAAFEHLVRRHGPAVLATCQNILPGADADDAFQAAFVALARDTRKVRSAVGGWLTVVAHRTAVRMRAAARRRSAVESRHSGPAGADADPSWREAVALLHQEVDVLPDAVRRPLVLCYLRGLTRDEAATELGLSVDALKGRLERGRLKLKARLAKRGLTLSAGLLAAVAAPAEATVPSRLLRAATSGATTVAGATVPRLAYKGVALLGLAAALLVAVAAGRSTLPVNAGQPKSPASEARKPEVPADAIVVKGRVLGPDGEPASGARLLILEEDRKPAPQPATDADGKFAFTVPAGPGFKYRYLLATAPGVGCDWAVIPAFKSPGEVTLKLPEDVPITGRLLSLEGKPVTGAEVRLESISAAASGSLDEFLRAYPGPGHERSINLLDKPLYEGEPLAGLFHATSDAAGQFTIRGVGKDRVPGFIIRSRDHTQDAIRVATRPGFRDAFDPKKHTYRVVGPDFTLTLAPSPPVSGVVRDAATKKPLAGVRVACGFKAEASFLRQWHQVETTTDAGGRYTLRGTAAEKETVLLFDPPRGSEYLHYYAKAESNTAFGAKTFDVELRRGVVVEGRLTDKDTGRPVRAHVFYAPLEGNDFAEKTPGYEWLPWGASPTDDHAQTDDDGRYRLVVLPGPGVLHIQTWDLNATVYPPTRLDPKDKGRVYGPAMPGMADFVVFKTAGRGGYYGPESVNAYHVIDPKPADTVVRADRTLWAGRSLKIRVLDVDGRPLTGAEAMGLEPSHGMQPVRTDAVVTGLDPDHPRRLLFRHTERMLSALVEFKGDEREPVEVRVGPAGTITGRVVDKDGRGVADVAITASYQDHPIGTVLNTEKMHSGPARPLKSDADGRFRVEGLPVGVRLRLNGEKKGAFSGTTNNIRLKSGQVVDLGDWKGG